MLEICQAVVFVGLGSLLPLRRASQRAGARVVIPPRAGFGGPEASPHYTSFEKANPRREGTRVSPGWVGLGRRCFLSSKLNRWVRIVAGVL